MAKMVVLLLPPPKKILFVGGDTLGISYLIETRIDFVILTLMKFLKHIIFKQI